MWNKIYEYTDKINENKEKLENKIEYKLMEIKSLNKKNFYLKENDKKIYKERIVWNSMDLLIMEIIVI